MTQPSLWGGGQTQTVVTAPSAINIPALRGITGSAQMPVVLVLSHTDLGDGGDDPFYWDVAATGADDNGYLIKPIALLLANPGRWKRLSKNRNVVDIHEYGGKGGNVNADSDAFQACSIKAQASGGTGPNIIRALGTYTFDPTRWTYADNNRNGFGGFITVELGGNITFTSTYYQTRGSRIRGIAGAGAAQFSPASGLARITGNIENRASNNELENLFLNGQIFLNGGIGAGAGNDCDSANVILRNCHAQRQINGGAVPSAFKITNKFWVTTYDCTWQSVDLTNFATPTVTVDIYSDFEVGLLYFHNTISSFGNVKFRSANLATDAWFTFDKWSHESLNCPALFDIIGNGACSNWIFDTCILADNISGNKLFAISNVNSVRLINTIKGGTISANFLKYDDCSVAFAYSIVDFAIDWNITTHFELGQMTSQIPWTENYEAKPTYSSDGNGQLYGPAVPSPGAGWGAIAGGSLDGITPSYRKAVVAGAQVFVAPNGYIPVPSHTIGDVMVIGFMYKRQTQTQVIPALRMQMLDGGGVGTIDGFGGLSTTYNTSLMGRVGGTTWDFIYGAFKISTAAVNTTLAWLEPAEATGNLDISHFQVLFFSGNPDFKEVHRKVCANMMPSSRSSVYTRYKSHISVPQMYNTDTGLDPTVVGQMGILGHLKMQDGKNIKGNTVTGTKIGEAANEKWSAYGLPPDVQPTNAVAGAAFVANTSAIADDTATWGGWTVGKLVTALKRLGWIA